MHHGDFGQKKHESGYLFQLVATQKLVRLRVGEEIFRETHLRAPAAHEPLQLGLN